MKKKIYIVRHGETDACESSSGSVDKNVLMNEKGRAQIEKILPKIPKSIGKIFTSPTLRTIETAQMIQVHSMFSTLEVDGRLYNKMADDEEYEDNIRTLLDGLEKDPEPEIVLVTHGRIVKILFSILSVGRIDRSVMDILHNLSYGSLTILEHGWYCTLLDG